MFGLFNEHDCLNDRIETLENRLLDEQLVRAKLTSTVKDLQEDVKNIWSELHGYLKDKYYKDPANTLKEIFDKYKYTKFDEAPLHIKYLLREQKLIYPFMPEQRTIGRILENQIVLANGSPTKVSCVGCSKVKEGDKKEEYLKAMEMDKYNELMESYAVDPDSTIKKIYNKYKYKKLDEVPYHIKWFITERYFIDLKDEKRVVGQILEDKHKDLLCCECKCDKKKGRKK